MPNFDPAREELEHVSGDLPDDDGQGRLGLFDLTRNAFRVRVRYRDQAIFCEVYALPGEPMQIHWACPRCGPLNKKRMSTIWSHQKKIEFDPRSQIEDGGRLNVERFKCPWELESAGRRMEFGLGMCGLELVFDNSRAREV
jgi:hypothetical protein